MILDMSALSVLVIDDNTHMRSLFRAILGGFGIRRIYEASDGSAGLSAMIDRRPDIAICDWLMTPLSGAEFLTILRNDTDKGVAATPVILVTADARKQVVLTAARLGIDEFLAKPVSPATLYQRLTRVVAAPPRAVPSGKPQVRRAPPLAAPPRPAASAGVEDVIFL